MWPKTRRMNALLTPLAAVILGEVAGHELTGSYSGYAVEARPRRGFPMTNPGTGGPTPPGQVDSFKVTLSGVPGAAMWHCQSSPQSLLQDAASRFTAGRALRAFQPGEFKFEGVDRARDAHERRGAKLGKAMGVPIESVPDKDVQERLVAAGLFEELAALRWGSHPFLPMAEFTPPASQLMGVYMRSSAFARVEANVTDRLHAAGFPDLESVLAQRAAEADAKSPGKLTLEVEVGKARIPSPERFRELLDHGVQIAQINVQANPPSRPG